MKTILATIALMAGQAAADGRRLAADDPPIGNVNSIGNPNGSPWAGYHTATNYALKPETCADGSAATKVIYRSIFDQLKQADDYTLASTKATKQKAAMDECYNTAVTWCAGESVCTGLSTSTSDTFFGLKPLVSGGLISDYNTGTGLHADTEHETVPIGCVALRQYNPGITDSATGDYRVVLNGRVWKGARKNPGYKTYKRTDKPTATVHRDYYSMDREYVKRTCPIVARQFRRFEAFKDFDIVETNPGDSIGHKMAYDRIYTNGGGEHQYGCVIRPIGNSEIWYLNGGVRTQDVGPARDGNVIVWGFQWKNDGRARKTQSWCDSIALAEINYCGLLQPEVLSQAHADGNKNPDRSIEYTTEAAYQNGPIGYKTFYPFSEQNDLTSGVMVRRGWFTIPSRGSAGYLGCEGDAADHTSVAASKAYCNAGVSTPAFFQSGNPDIAGQSPNPKMLYPDFGCDTCTGITGAKANSFTCASATTSVFVNAQDSDCTDGNEVPITTYVPHACLPKSNGCPAGFQVQNANCQSCSKDDALNTDANCKHKTGCACKFDVNFKSTNSTQALYELRPTGRCKFKSMNDLFEYRYELYEGTDQDKEGIVKHMKNVTGSSVEEFVKQDYLLRKTTVRVSLTKYDDVVTADNVQGYKYYNFDKQQATESWIEFDSSANPAAKSGKVQDLGTICWIKPSSKNDCIFDPAKSCDRDFTKAQYMATGHNITANGRTVMTDDCDIIQFVEPLIDTRAVSASIPDKWQTDLDITSTGDDTLSIIRGFTPNGDSYVMDDEVETKIAMHKLIGIASECIDTNAQTYARTQPGAAANANSENIFAWGDLQARVKFNMVAKVKLLRSEEGSDTGYLVGGFTNTDPTANNKKSDLFDLLFVSGENIMDVNVELNGEGQTQGNMVFKRLTNGPQSSFNQLIVDHDSFICTTSLDIKTSGGNFDCFGAGSTATGDSAQEQTGGYFHTTLDSNGYYGHTWDQQAIVNNTAEYNNISDWISQLAVTTPSLHATTPCTASVETTCGERIIKVTDHRKCFNFHGMDAGNPIDQFDATNEAVNNTSIYDLLDATGACEKPKEDASTVESDISVHTVVVERLRLSTERVFPAKEVDTGGTTLFETDAESTYLNVHYPSSTSDWECDDPACTTDPYHVIYNVDAPHDNDATCQWTELINGASGTWSRGVELLTGCKDNATSLVSNCQSPLGLKGYCSGYTVDSGDLDLYMPPASFPHFYVYAMSTVSSEFPETDSIGASNGAGVTNQIISTKTRRLGSKKLLASKSKLLASKGRKLTLSKSRFVISKTHILH